MKLLVVLACVFVVVASQDDATNCEIPCRAGITRNFSHPTDCTKYVECKDGRAAYKACPDGFKYSTSKKECVSGIGGAGQGCIPCYSKRPDDY